jgi:Na+/proline symporter/signal transduction histidine kinase
MNATVVILLIVGYLIILFLLAFYIDKRANDGKILIKNPWMYALSLPVYCTAWTYFGSVGKASRDGLEFLTIYIGPLLMMPLWWIVLRKIIRICQVQRMSTLADFISARYNNSVFVSVLVSLFAIIGVIPYISIQLKAIVSSFDVLVYNAHLSYADVPGRLFFNDSSFYLTIILAIFIILFAFRTVDTTDKHHGMIGAIAFESVFKLLAFLLIGGYITFSVFDGFGDVFAQGGPQMSMTYGQISSSGMEWFILILLSMSAVILLPRQFQVAVAENYSENHIKKAAWVFPLYLLLINIFVIPIAIGGNLLLSNSVDPDSYVLALPLSLNREGLAMLTFLGGFSAATGMIIVSTIALSLMVSNNIVVPLTLKQMERKMMHHRFPLQTRRISVFVILMLSYLYYVYVSDRFSLVSIGLISFTAIAQFAPSVIGALFWKDANRTGTLLGLIVGFALWMYTLAIPNAIESGLIDSHLISDGLFNQQFLKPQSLLGLEMKPITHGAFWSLLFNGIFFVFGSLLSRQSAKERNMAELYVDIFSYSSTASDRVIWKGEMVFNDLKDLLGNLIGHERTSERITFYQETYGKPLNQDNTVNSRFVNYSERLLTGVVGAASARLLISSLSKEEEIEIEDVIKILKESTEISSLNKELKIKSRELEKRTEELENVNNRLKILDIEKDDFISTVTHEMRTPLTSIKAMVEIILDHPDLSKGEQDRFLNTVLEQIDRMARLINQVLDLEKLETGQTHLDKRSLSINVLINETVNFLQPLANEKKIHILNNVCKNQIELQGDEERLRLVMSNLISNAIKSIDHEHGQIEITCKDEDQVISIKVADNGKGIKSENIEHIFDKFFQARDQTSKKPKGSGLGLSISKKIIELHGGHIMVHSKVGEGSAFIFSLPKM